MRYAEGARHWATGTPTIPGYVVAQAGHEIGIDVPAGARVAQKLIARRVIVDCRPGRGIRVSAHLYTTDDEVDRFFSELNALRK